MVIPLKDSAVDPDVENMLPPEMSVHLKELEKRFGGMEIIFVVVENDDILLICKKSNEQQIRQFVDDVKTKKGNKFV